MKKIIPALTSLIVALTASLSLSASDNDSSFQLESTDTVPAFIELYTSQGCSSCPPADKYLNSLKKDKGLFKDFIPMAFHVDYWDYLGWKDPFASAANSNRQRIYKTKNKSNSVYTPQFIISDQEWRGFFKRRKANTKSEYKNPNKLIVNFDGQKLNARYSADATNLHLHTALLGIGTETKVPRGENAGKTLRQDFIVLSHQIMRSDTNSWQVEIDQPTATVSDLALVSWVTDKNDSKPLQAVASYLPESIWK